MPARNLEFIGAVINKAVRWQRFIKFVENPMQKTMLEGISKYYTFFYFFLTGFSFLKIDTGSRYRKRYLNSVSMFHGALE